MKVTVRSTLFAVVTVLVCLAQTASAGDWMQTALSGFSGRYFGYEGQTLHTWDFNPDGSFLHTRVVSGSGTNVRNSERGTFQLVGNYVEMRVSKTASAFTTPSVGGRGTLIGGGSDEKAEVQRVPIEFLPGGKGIVLGGIKLGVKTW